MKGVERLICDRILIASCMLIFSLHTMFSFLNMFICIFYSFVLKCQKILIIKAFEHTRVFCEIEQRNAQFNECMYPFKCLKWQNEVCWYTLAVHGQGLHLVFIESRMYKRWQSDVVPPTNGRGGGTWICRQNFCRVSCTDEPILLKLGISCDVAIGLWSYL